MQRALEQACIKAQQHSGAHWWEDVEQMASVEHWVGVSCGTLVSHTWASAPKGDAHATGLRVGILRCIDCYTSVDSSSPWQSVRVRELKAAVACTRLVTIIGALHITMSAVITL